MTTWYKGYGIDYNFYGNDEYSVQYCGDDYMFDSENTAKAFIDSVQIDATCLNCKHFKCDTCERW